MKRTKIYILLSLTFLFLVSTGNSQNTSFGGGPKYTTNKVVIWIKNKFSGNSRKTKEELAYWKNQIPKPPPPTTITTTSTSTTASVNSTGTQDAWTEELVLEINNITDEIDRLIKEVDNLNPFNLKNKKRLNEIEIQLTNLIKNKIIPFKRIELQILKPKIISDYSFNTGKSSLNNNAKDDIKSFSKDWENEILAWFNYKDKDGKNVYQNESIQIRINIIGYADKQGSDNEAVRMQNNRVLSEKRAESVKREVQESLKNLNDKYNLDPDYIVVGKGEELPLNVIDTELINNPERRKVIVTAVIFPKILLKKRKD